jgi:MYXO-CTERM domain-containing protein/uncharacterized repeat protein (TIGR01451 family)
MRRLPVQRHRFFALSTVLGTFLAASSALPACSSNAPPEQLGSTQAAVFTNGDFETTTGTGPVPGWTVDTYLNPLNTGITVQTPQTRAGLNLATGGKVLTSILTGTAQADPMLGATQSLRYCRYGTHCVLVNSRSSTDYNSGGSNNGRNVNALTQTMTVASGDVDPADGKIHVRFAVAPLLENPNHPANQQPYYMVQVTNLTKSLLLYSDFNLSAQAGVPWTTYAGTNPSGPTEYDYVDWSLVDVSPDTTKLAIGDQIKIEIIAAGCARGGHVGEIYVDGVGATVPGIFVWGTAPASVNANADIPYTVNYKNGGTLTETGVVITFAIPAGTTYKSSTTPAGATCTTPAVGATGNIVCTFSGSVAPGASGSFNVTVGTTGTPTGTQITEGNYSIKSTQETPLIGAKIITFIGCTDDYMCGSGSWCNITAKTCTPTVANGTTVPTDAGHTTPVINGTCTAAVGAIVCTSAVCETSDNKCGYLNGGGTCTTGNGGIVCRSGVCSTDGKCGYGTGEGPCTTANQATVCRSGSCSASGTCKPAAGCNVDADCTGGNWCMESTHTCTAKLTNGTAMPTDAPHTSPTLNGTCTAAAGTLVCAAGVCDTDNKCGLANGDGTCTTANQATVCRSGLCSATGGKCIPTGGCVVDADCTGGKWCNVSTLTCTDKVANGGNVPTDAKHGTPTLDGKCTTAAATLTCVSAVCETSDNKCGYANGGTSTCTSTNATTVCRSSTCGADGKCGLANGEGTCTAANGATICRSAICDAADSKCGYADGDGPCTVANGATVCRSGICGATSGKCIPVGGCNTDSDCTGGKWCNMTTLTCTAKVDNGGAVPSDGKHTSPTLDGTCSAAAGSLTCLSGVCDTRDNKCGYDNGAPSTCTSANAATVCRSGACSSTGTCMPAGACLADADCTAGNWCNIASKTCAPKVDNGGSMPTDTGHTTPTLDGKCTTDASALVCKTAACDPTDDKCGLANGTTCVAGEDAKCRAGVCFTDLKCGKPIGETCTGSTECRDGQCVDGKCDKDSDGDGVSDGAETKLGTDPNNPDTDGDGIKDNVELSADHSGNGPYTGVDTDKDGTIDALDTDDDGDSLLTKDELGSGGAASPQDTDGDGKPNYLDDDDDNDTIPTKKEVADGKDPKVNSDDVDDDGKKNWLDTDSDGDKILDKDEPNDANGDGIPDYLEAAGGANGPDASSVEGGGCSTSGTGGTGNVTMLAGLLALGAATRLRLRRRSRG